MAPARAGAIVSGFDGSPSATLTEAGNPAACGVRVMDGVDPDTLGSEQVYEGSSDGARRAGDHDHDEPFPLYGYPVGARLILNVVSYENHII